MITRAKSPPLNPGLLIIYAIMLPKKKKTNVFTKCLFHFREQEKKKDSQLSQVASICFPPIYGYLCARMKHSGFRFWSKLKDLQESREQHREQNGLFPTCAKLESVCSTEGVTSTQLQPINQVEMWAILLVHTIAQERREICIFIETASF